MSDNEWETEVYARGRQVNRWPFSDLVSDVMNTTAGQDRSSLSVLELGCGTGNNVWFFLELGMNVCGLDISPTAIEIARQRVAELGFEQPDLRIGSITKLPWQDGAFDLVIDRSALPHLRIDEVSATVREVSRVLKPGGRFFSYYLFGWNSSCRKLGHEFAPRSFRGFTGGRFAKGPTATLFDAPLIHELWQPLSIEQLRRHEITVEGTDVVEEFFDVRAVKDVGGSGRQIDTVSEQSNPED
jgi:SAM-dependent methyltransferase